MSAELGSISVSLGADDTALRAGLASAGVRMKAFGESLKGIGTTLSAAVTLPLVAFGVSSVRAFGESTQAIAALEAGLASTGNAIGITSQQFQDLATEMSNSTLFSDEELLNASTQLLTFGNISRDVFERAQQAATNLSAKLGTDLQGSTIMLGKALNDPIRGLTALGKAGVQFTDSQKAQITAMTEAGNLLGAQGIILSELEQYYGGAALAAYNAAPAYVKAAKSIGEAQEAIGRIITEALGPLAEKVKEAADAFQALDPATQKTIVVVLAVAAAVGPLLVAFGGIVAAIGAALPAIGGLTLFLATLSGPVVLIVAGLAALAVVVYRNRDAIMDFANRGTLAMVALRAAIQGAVARILEVYADLYRAIGQVIPGFTQLGEAFDRAAARARGFQASTNLDLSAMRAELRRTAFEATEFGRAFVAAANSIKPEIFRRVAGAGATPAAPPAPDTSPTFTPGPSGTAALAVVAPAVTAARTLAAALRDISDSAASSVRALGTYIADGFTTPLEAAREKADLLRQAYRRAVDAAGGASGVSAELDRQADAAERLAGMLTSVGVAFRRGGTEFAAGVAGARADLDLARTLLEDLARIRAASPRGQVEATLAGRPNVRGASARDQGLFDDRQKAALQESLAGMRLLKSAADEFAASLGAAFGQFVTGKGNIGDFAQAVGQGLVKVLADLAAAVAKAIALRFVLSLLGIGAVGSGGGVLGGFLSGLLGAGKTGPVTPALIPVPAVTQSRGGASFEPSAMRYNRSRRVFEIHGDQIGAAYDDYLSFRGESGRGG